MIDCSLINFHRIFVSSSGYKHFFPMTNYNSLCGVAFEGKSLRYFTGKVNDIDRAKVADPYGPDPTQDYSSYCEACYRRLPRAEHAAAKANHTFSKIKYTPEEFLVLRAINDVEKFRYECSDWKSHLQLLDRKLSYYLGIVD